MKKTKLKFPQRILFFSCFFIPYLSFAGVCKGHFVNPITDICWDCLFPLSIGGASVVKSSYPDAPASKKSKNPVCACQEGTILRPGIKLGYWEPFALVDVTRQPFCFVNLGGTQIDIKSMGRGGSQYSAPEASGAFYYTHWYAYPLIYWLKLITSAGCMQPGDIDIPFVSELDPTWSDSSLAFALNPESVLFGNPIARASCVADSVKSLKETAINSLFWCQGSQGSTYPLNGFVSHQVSPIQAATLLTERTNFKLHRLGLIEDSVDEDSLKLCRTYKSVMMPKNRYRYQMVNTIPEAKRCHPFGQSTAIWQAGHINPADGDNFGFAIWRKRNCCFL